MDALLKDLWAEIHELGFFVVGIELFIELIILELIILLRMSEFSNDQLTDSPSTVPDYDYFIDESLCDSINNVDAVTTVSRQLLLHVMSYVNTTSNNRLICFECFRKLEVGYDGGQ